MLRHHLLSALRQARKNPGYMLLNVSVLSAGFLAGLVLLAYGFYQLSYDRFHSNPESVYSLEMSYQPEGMSQMFFPPDPILADMLQKQTAVTEVTRIYREEVASFQQPGEGVPLKGGRGYRVDPAFVQLFHFPLKYGTWDGLFNGTRKVVISHEIANRLNQPNPIGQSIYLNDAEQPYAIVGVLDPVPSNSSLKFEFVTATTSEDSLIWFAQESPLIYARFQEPGQVGAVVASLQEQMDAEMGPGVDILSVSLPDQYYDSRLLDERGDPQRAKTLMMLAVVILLIGVLNYVNSYTSLLTKRTKELGVRIILGSRRTQILGQSMADALVVFVLALGLAWLLLILGEDTLFGLLGVTGTSLSRLTPVGPVLVCTLALLTISLLLVSIYPVLLFKRYNPVMVVRADQGNLSFAGRFRLVLVGLQMVVAVVLIDYAVVLGHQMNYLNQLPLGFEKDGKMMVSLSGLSREGEQLEAKLAQFRQAALQSSSITGVAISPFPVQYDVRGVKIHTEELYNFYWQESDPSFVSVMGIELAEGQDFSEENRNAGVLINETAAKLLFPNRSSVGELLPEAGDKQILGVMKDFYFKGFVGGMGPLVVTADVFSPSYLHVGVTDFAQGQATLTTVWRQIFPDYPADFEPLEAVYDERYLSDQKADTRLMLLAAMVAILLASLGVLGIAAFNVKNRSREMSIRHVLGATQTDLLSLQARYFLGTVLVAVVLGIPAAYYLGGQYLENYSIRPSFPYPLLMTGVVLVILLVVGAVVAQFLGYRKENPTNHLRS